jgi:hypothetical protein
MNNTNSFSLLLSEYIILKSATLNINILIARVSEVRLAGLDLASSSLVLHMKN